MCMSVCVHRHAPVSSRPKGQFLHPLPWHVAYLCKKVKAERCGEVQKRLPRSEVRPGSLGLRFCRPAAWCGG